VEKTQGNPEIGMQADSFDTADALEGSGSENFFNDLDNQVNGGIVDTEVTPNQQSDPKQVTHVNNEEGSNNVAQSNNSTDWEKRYTDSSREAVKWRDKYQQVEKFVPVLDAMKEDSGLVDHVRNYLVEGGAPAKSIQEKLKLDEDFQFDQQEAMTNPDSDSAKVMNAHVDSLVQNRVGEMVETEQQRAQQIYAAKQAEQKELDFKQKNNMNDEQFAAFKDQAKNHIMTLDDINTILNKDTAAKNVASSTKQEMLNQMKNVRSMPTSASGANSQGEVVTEDRNVFNSILGNSTNVDNLFG
tara:strand:- start:455 stop:1351 length:897 start_codon:yes stop_codon:yes gene_type:complete